MASLKRFRLIIEHYRGVQRVNECSCLSVYVCVCMFMCLCDLISIRNIDRDQCLILPFKIAARTEFQKSLPTLRVYMYACCGYICMPARVYMCVRV